MADYYLIANCTIAVLGTNKQARKDCRYKPHQW